MKIVSKQEYSRRVEEVSPPSPVGKDCLLAFLFGGAVCTLGQAVQLLPELGAGDFPGQDRGVHQPDFPLRAAHRLGPLRQNRPARRGGTLVPITGFANSMVSPRWSLNPRALSTAWGPRLFSIAGPVLVYGSHGVGGVMGWCCLCGSGWEVPYEAAGPAHLGV